MDEEKNSLLTVILGWILAYASYAAITFAVMECLAVISMSYLAIGGTDVSFIQNLGYANGNLDNNNANIGQAQIMDIFVYFFAGITIISELVGFIIKRSGMCLCPHILLYIMCNITALSTSFIVSNNSQFYKCLTLKK